MSLNPRDQVSAQHRFYCHHPEKTDECLGYNSIAAALPLSTMIRPPACVESVSLFDVIASRVVAP
eukprot:scaffold239485_cov33-Tisochrysis_lutea.AAC.1